MLKQAIKKIIVFALRTEAKLILRKYKPKIIGVTGTVGKTSAKDAIYAVVSSEFYARKNEKSYNSEIGVPLTVIGAKTAWNNPLRWIFILLKGVKLLAARYDYPELLVLEMGVDRPRDMEKLVSWVKPSVAVITRMGDIPVHIEYFKNLDELAKEKAKLLKELKQEDYAVLNWDDAVVAGLKAKTKANVIAYGFSETGIREDLDLTASNYRVVYREEGGRDIPEGIIFKVDYKGNIVPVRLYGVFGKQAVYNTLAALGTASVLGINMVEAAESLSVYKSPPGRLKLIEGIKRSFIIDDSYNSSPVALEAAMEVLKDIPVSAAASTGKMARKIAVLGDMLELGRYTIEEHKEAGRMAKETADILFTVGPRSKFAAEEARALGFNPENIFEFSTADEAKTVLQDEIKEGDLILVKGSQSMRMEKIVEEIMAHPEDKEELLVRQEKEWAKR